MNAMVAGLPTGRRGLALALALVLLVLALFWLGVASPLMGFYDDRADELGNLQLKASHMAQLATQLPSLKQRADAAGRSGQTQTLVWEGPSDAVAAAALQSKMQEMASAAGANLSSVENLQVEPLNPNYHRIGLKIALNATWPNLVNLLKSVEMANPPLLIDDIQVHGSPLPRLNVNRGLEANFTVYALRTGKAGDRKS
jgi:general secretion pathway protein M